MGASTVALICCGLLILAVIIIALVYVHGSDNFEGLDKEYRSNLQSIINEIQDSHQKEIDGYQADLDEKKRDCARQEEFYLNELQQKKESYETKARELEDKLIALTEQKSREEANSIESIVAYYANERARLQEEQITFEEKIKARMDAAAEKVAKEEARVAEIIEQHKREEKIRKEKDFYRIVLSEDAVHDVQNLRKIAEQLRNPTILYKLIYKEYYEKPFSEMVGRIVQGRGSIGIYKITNTVNGRVYIGQTKQAFKERWRTHLKRGVKAEPGTQNKLYKAMWEEGPENFTFEVLAECPATELNQKEREYISLYHADTWGYNSTGGNS